MEKAQINEFIEQHKQEAVALLEELGKIPAPSHKEGKRAAFCKKWFEQTGCNEVWIDEAQNFISSWNWRRHRKSGKLNDGCKVSGSSFAPAENRDYDSGKFL